MIITSRKDPIMQWERLGKIFDPSDHQLANDCVDFAQSPQVLDLGDRVRVYFSTRQVDSSNGKFLSHISYVDYSRDFAQILSVAPETVIPLGNLGCFDQHGIFPMHVFRHQSRILGFTCGWNRRASVSVDTAIGLSESFDGGMTFQRLNVGPVMTATPNEPFLVGDPFVLEAGGLLHMWYIFGLRWLNEPRNQPPDRVYKIAHATSPDGIVWQRNGQVIIPNVLDENECQALPSVVHWEGRWRMIFCFRHAQGFRTDPSRGYRLGYAVSDDLQHWQRDDDALGLSISGNSNDWDGEMMCYPHFAILDGHLHIFYNGNRFGRNGFGLARLKEERIHLRRNTALAGTIQRHLEACDISFTPPLHCSVTIHTYAEKIRELAETFEVWEDDELAGLLAVYLNDLSSGWAFITNISVLPQCTGRGLGGRLLAKAIEHVRTSGLRGVRLEVHEDNTKARALYAKHGFIETERKPSASSILILQNAFSSGAAS